MKQETTTLKAKKITLSTVKSFVRNNRAALLINVKSSFDGMTDGCESLHAGFVQGKATADFIEHTLGIQGAWFVGSSRDYFSPYNENGLTGIDVSNSCGHFILAIPTI